MISGERDAARDARAQDLGAFAFLPKPFNAADIDLLLHDIHGLRSPNLQLRGAERELEVAIHGSTIRLVHNGSGDVFEYLWFKHAPHLRNPTAASKPGRKHQPGAARRHRRKRGAQPVEFGAVAGGLAGGTQPPSRAPRRHASLSPVPRRPTILATIDRGMWRASLHLSLSPPHIVKGVTYALNCIASI